MNSADLSNESTAIQCACASPRAKWVPGPPKLLLLTIVAMVLLHFVAPGLRFPFPAWELLGLVPLVAGLALNLLADRSFKVAGTTVKPMLASTALVCDGPFRLTRNPMYLGFILLLLALWSLLGSLTPGAAIVVFAVLIDRYFVRPEEEKLAWTFGPAYAEYCRKVRRWA